jgi:hypothetical protein
VEIVKKLSTCCLFAPLAALLGLMADVTAMTGSKNPDAHIGADIVICLVGLGVLSLHFAAERFIRAREAS